MAEHTNESPRKRPCPLTPMNAQAIDLIEQARANGSTSVAVSTPIGFAGHEIPAHFVARNAGKSRILVIGEPFFVRDLVSDIKSIDASISLGDLGANTDVVITSQARALRAATNSPELLAGFDVAWIRMDMRRQPDGERALVDALKGTALVQSAPLIGREAKDEQFLLPPEVTFSMRENGGWDELERPNLALASR